MSAEVCADGENMDSVIKQGTTRCSVAVNLKGKGGAEFLIFFFLGDQFVKYAGWFHMRYAPVLAVEDA